MGQRTPSIFDGAKLLGYVTAPALLGVLAILCVSGVWTAILASLGLAVAWYVLLKLYNRVERQDRRHTRKRKEANRANPRRSWPPSPGRWGNP